MIRKRILLANDPELLHAVQNSFFGRNGFTLLVADSDRQAFEMIEEKDPALAILCLDLPGMRGDACCRRVKSDPFLRATSVILVAPSGSQQALKRCREAGCDSVLHAPIDAQKLLAAACRLLDIAERVDPRHDVRLPLRFGAEPDKLRAGEVRNLNAGGVFVATDRLFPVDSLLVLEFALPGRAFPLRCRGRVAWVNHPEWVKTSRLPIGMGIQFLDLAADDFEGLRRHLAQEG